MKKISVSLLLVFSVALFSHAQPSSKELRNMESFIEKAMSDWQVPGVAIGIVQGDEVIYTNGFGLADLESGRAVDENTLFAIGSSSKAFTAFSVLQLVRDDLVELDEPVRTYLPEFEMFDQYVGNHLTVRDLLCHRSGLPRHDVVWYGAPDTREELFHKLKYLEPSAGFREIFQYQNLMYMTAGYLVGQMRQSSWENEVQQRILTPLGMERANFSVDEMKDDLNHALPYLNQEDSLVKIDFRNIDAVGPAGSINASAREMTHWVLTQLNGGTYNESELLPASVLAEAHTSTIPVPNGWAGPLAFDNGGGPMTYGLGWFISTHKGREILQHGGNIDGFSAMVAFLPEESIGVVVLTNLNGNPLPAIIRNYVVDMLLEEDIRDWNNEFLTQRNQNRVRQDSVQNQEDLKRVKDTTPSHPMSDYAGSYSHPAYGTVEVKPQGDSLDVTYNSIHALMGHYHYDVFDATHPIFGPLKITFHTNVEGDVSHLEMKLEPSVDPIEFDRTPPPMELSAEDLAEFTGEYMIQGVQRVTVAAEDGVLTLTVPGQPTYTLEPISSMKFNLKDLPGFSALFQKDESGRVNAMVLLQPNGQFKGTRVKE